MAVEVRMIGGEMITVQGQTGSGFIDLLNGSDEPRRRGDYVYVQREDGEWVWLNIRAIGWVKEV